MLLRCFHWLAQHVTISISFYLFIYIFLTYIFELIMFLSNYFVFSSLTM